MKKEQTKIIGYTAPFDIEECEIKKGDTISRYKGTGIYNIIAGKEHHHAHALPPEIVEKWEPVFDDLKLKDLKFTSDCCDADITYVELAGYYICDNCKQACEEKISR
jgi:hypothetical protein